MRERGDLGTSLAGADTGSVVVQRESGDVLVRSRAVLQLCQTLGGFWRLISWIACIVPRPLLDLAYDGVARVRKRLGGVASSECPFVDSDLNRRFLA